jgi:ribonuclease HIII
MNAIKARLHNQAFLHMKKAHPEIDHLYLDQFCSPDNYYQYISVDKEKVNGITFREKGESAYPSIALGSIISRYSFILKMDELNKKYHTHIPYGAGNKVNDFAKSFVKKYGIKELEKIVKKNFKNYKEIIDNN